MMSDIKKAIIKIIFALLVCAFVNTTQAQNVILKNNYLSTTFNDGGTISIYDKQLKKNIRIDSKRFNVKINGEILDGASFKKVKKTNKYNSVTYHFKKGKVEIKVVYELKKGWRFVSKQLFIKVMGDSEFNVQQIVMLKGSISNIIANEYSPQKGKYGAFLRLTDNKSAPASYGVFFDVQNPFMKWHRDGKRISVNYSPGMEWKEKYGTFKSDRALIGTYKLSGQTYRANMIYNWQYEQHPDKVLNKQPQIDYNEVKALSNCIGKFLMVKPDSSLHIDVGWTMNDYQIDVAATKGRKVYKRVIDQAAALGNDYLLYSPANSNLSSLDQNADAWGWENVLWLGLGQKIRKGEWNPDKDSIPPIVQDMRHYASSKGVGLIAYAYPSLPWAQHKEFWIKNKNGQYAGIDNGLRSFQNWFIDLLVRFYKKTGIKGYSFDYWFMGGNQPGVTSRYAQWYGFRRILETLRKRIPDIVIDGRQSYNKMGPWTWLAGSYPHPLDSDEQPQSFNAFPDLSWDRVSADRQRWAAWWYRVNQFTPVEITPGYMTHQTERFNADGKLIRTPFRIRDWDYMGWKYSVLSSIATAPFNLVMNYMPARDTTEVKYFPGKSKQWLNHWFGWVNDHIKYMHNLRPIISQPMVGRADGSSAIINDQGYVFLFNPNYRTTNAKFKLDKSIGLKTGDKFVIKALHPKQKGYIAAPNGGYWKYGQEVNLPLNGTQADVFEIIPVRKVNKPLLLNAAGKVKLKGNTVVATNVHGPKGHKRQLSFILPQNKNVKQLKINGKNIGFKLNGHVLTTDVKFDGARFDHAHQVGQYDASFDGGKYTASFSVPERIFEQLNHRRKSWPIPYTKNDLKATWVGPSRLLLFVQMAKPNPNMKVRMSIDGDKVNLKKAYTSVHPNNTIDLNTFMGYYADLSSVVKPDKKYNVTVTLPKMKPGQFQGLFFQNIKTEYTKKFHEAK